MPSLRFKWACLTPVLPSQSPKSESQERSAQASKLWHKTSGLASDSMISGSLSCSMESSTKASGPSISSPLPHAPQHQASQHQRPQQRFVPANHSGKSKNKSKLFKRPQKVEDDQYCRKPPIWMQSMMEWMGQ
jgi:hypothetical protein